MGKNNVQLLEEKNVTVQHWGLRKLSIGVASVLLGTTAYLGLSNGAVVHADTVTASNNNENVTVSSNGAASQNLYQSDSIQTSKATVNMNPTEATQSVSRDVTNSNKQIEGQRNRDNNNRNNSWGSTFYHTHDTDVQVTDAQKKINYVADNSKTDQAAYSDSKIKVGFDSQWNQMEVKSSVAHITYQFVDDDDNNETKVGEAVTISGNNAAVNLSIPDNYGLVVGQEFPTKVDASVDGKSYVVHLRHLRMLGFRRKPVKRVINYVDEQGHSLHPSVTQDAGLVGEYGYRDLVTGKAIWDQYHVGDDRKDGSFMEYQIPQYKGYTSYANGVKSTVVPEAYATVDAAGKPIQLDTVVEVEY